MDNKTKILSMSAVAFAATFSTINLTNNEGIKSAGPTITSMSVDWTKTNADNKELPTWTFDKASIDSASNKNVVAILYNSSSTGLVNGGIQGGSPIDITWDDAYYYNFLKLSDTSFNNGNPAKNNTGIVYDSKNSTDATTQWVKYPGSNNTIDWTKKDNSLELGVVVWDATNNHGQVKYRFYDGSQLDQGAEGIEYSHNINPTIKSSLTLNSLESTEFGITVKYDVNKNDQEGNTQIFVSSIGLNAADAQVKFSGISNDINDHDNNTNSRDLTNLESNTTYYVWAVMDGQTYDFGSIKTKSQAISITSFDVVQTQPLFDDGTTTTNAKASLSAVINNPDNLVINTVEFKYALADQDFDTEATSVSPSDITNGRYFATANEFEADKQYNFRFDINYTNGDGDSIDFSSEMKQLQFTKEDIQYPTITDTSLTDVVQPSKDNGWKGSLEYSYDVYTFNTDYTVNKITTQIYKDDVAYSDAEEIDYSTTPLITPQDTLSISMDNLDAGKYQVKFTLEYNTITGETKSVEYSSSEYRLLNKEYTEPTAVVSSMDITKDYNYSEDGSGIGAINANVILKDTDAIVDMSTPTFYMNNEVVDVTSVDNGDGTTTYTISEDSLVAGDYSLTMDLSTQATSNVDGIAKPFHYELGTYTVARKDFVIPKMAFAAAINPDQTLSLVIHSLSDDETKPWGDITNYRTSINITYLDGTKQVLNISTDKSGIYIDDRNVEFDENFPQVTFTIPGAISTDKNPITNVKLDTQVSGDHTQWVQVNFTTLKGSMVHVTPNENIWLPVIIVLTMGILLIDAIMFTSFAYIKTKDKREENI